MSDRCMRCLVSGRVQGVFFRASTQEQAQQLGLRGFARNLSDGRVEVVACGDGEALTRMEGWLHDGPPQATVSGVEVEYDAEDPGMNAFTVR